MTIKKLQHECLALVNWKLRPLMGLTVRLGAGRKFSKVDYECPYTAKFAGITLRNNRIEPVLLLHGGTKLSLHEAWESMWRMYVGHVPAADFRGWWVEVSPELCVQMRAIIPPRVRRCKVESVKQWLNYPLVPQSAPLVGPMPVTRRRWDAGKS